MAKGSCILSVKFSGPYQGHVQTMLGPCLTLIDSEYWSIRDLSPYPSNYQYVDPNHEP